MPRHKQRLSGAQKAKIKRNAQRYKVAAPEEIKEQYQYNVEGLLKELAKGPKITGGPSRAKPRSTRSQINRFKRAVGRKRKRGRRPAGKVLPRKQKYQMQELKSVSRRGQPQLIIKVPKMIETADIGGVVSSSWIAAIYWYAAAKMAYMVLLNGYEYEVFIPFSVLEQWYWAHSKGTFFNGNIKGKYRVVRVK